MRSWGHGCPIVLVHGVALTSRVWAKQAAFLPRAGLRVVAYDQRGHGGSRAGSAGFTVAEFGRDLATVLEHLDLRDAVAVGHSMGGIAAQELLVEHAAVVRERVSGVVLLSTTVQPLLGFTRRVRLATRRVVPAFDPAMVMAHRSVGTALARIGFGRAPRASDVELTRRMLAGCDPVTSSEATRAIFGFDASTMLGEVAVPALVVVGTHDVITPPRDAHRLVAALPGARLEVIEGGGHMLMLEHTQLLDDLLIEFARSALPGRKGNND